MEKVIAIVVSHNRHQSLAACINAIRSQTYQPDAILVVNNGSADYTSVWLDNQSDIIHLYQENIGSAGGYHSGIAWAIKNKFTWIWCMDDEGYPKSDALEMMLSNTESGMTLYNSALLDKADKKSFVRETKQYKIFEEGNVIEGVSHSFNGTLIHHSIVEKVGLPNNKLFNEGGEIEYFFRITKRFNIPLKTINSSIHYHKKISLDFSKEWNIKSSVDLYYFIRNRHAILKTIHSNKLVALSAYIYFMMSFIQKIFYYQQQQKALKISFVLWPMMDALSNNYAAHPDFVAKQINHQYQDSFLTPIVKSFRNLFYSLFVPSIKQVSMPSYS